MKKENYVYYKDGKTIYYKIIDGDIMDYIADYEAIVKIIKTSCDIPNKYKLIQLVLIEKDDDEQEQYSKYFAIKIK